VNSRQWMIIPKLIIDHDCDRFGWTMVAFGEKGEMIALCSHGHNSPHEAMRCAEAHDFLRRIDLSHVRSSIKQYKEYKNNVAALNRCWEIEGEINGEAS
jgi:hypothetical protein